MKVPVSPLSLKDEKMSLKKLLEPSSEGRIARALSSGFCGPLALALVPVSTDKHEAKGKKDEHKSGVRPGRGSGSPPPPA